MFADAVPLAVDAADEGVLVICHFVGRRLDSSFFGLLLLLLLLLLAFSARLGLHRRHRYVLAVSSGAPPGAITAWCAKLESAV